MKRRDFLRVGAQSAVALSAVGMTFSALRSSVTAPFGSAHLSLPTDYLAYLKSIPEFLAIESIFNQYGPSQVLISDTLIGKNRNQIHLLTLNSSYGRFSNFSLEELTERAAANPSALRDLAVYTAGPSGKLLSENAPYTVVGRLSPELFSRGPLVLDAYPHYYNSMFLSTLPRPQGLSYFVDTTTRNPVWLKIESKTASKISVSDKNQVYELIRGLQNKIDAIERVALDQILEKTNRHEFATLTSLFNHVS